MPGVDLDKPLSPMAQVTFNARGLGTMRLAGDIIGLLLALEHPEDRPDILAQVIASMGIDMNAVTTKETHARHTPKQTVAFAGNVVAKQTALALTHAMMIEHQRDRLSDTIYLTGTELLHFADEVARQAVQQALGIIVPTTVTDPLYPVEFREAILSPS